MFLHQHLLLEVIPHALYTAYVNVVQSELFTL